MVRWTDATGIAELVRSGELSATEAVEEAVSAIQALNPTLNAVIHPMFDQAREAARRGVGDGPFAGVPVVVKDLVAEVAGEPFHEGMAYLRDLGYRAPADQALVAKLRAAGMIIVGKSNTSELGGMPTTEPLAHGPTHNPWGHGFSPGGSSGGSGAAVAAGMVPIGHANDAGGSIRIPASHCGLVGLKPTRGRVSQGPLYGDVFAGLIAEFAVCRSVRDAAGLLDVLAVPEPGDPRGQAGTDVGFRSALGQPLRRLHIAVHPGVPGGYGSLTSDVAGAVRAAALLLESLGHTVEEVHPPAMDSRAPVAVVGKTVFAATHWAVRRWERICGQPCSDDQLEPITRNYIERGRKLSAADLLDLEETAQLFTREVARWFADGPDLVLSATCATPPPPHGELQATTDADVPRALAASLPTLALTAWCNLTGLPAISLPTAQSDTGLPIGIQLVAAHGGEALLLQIAQQIEQAAPWSARQPV